jgi:hypothetical protein
MNGGQAMTLHELQLKAQTTFIILVKTMDSMQRLQTSCRSNGYLLADCACGTKLLRKACFIP